MEKMKSVGTDEESEARNPSSKWTNTSSEFSMVEKMKSVGIDEESEARNPSSKWTNTSSEFSMEKIKSAGTNEESEAARNPSLPEDTVSSILSRLPVKTLLRFSSVAKSWYSILTRPQFVKTHLTLSLNHKEQSHHRVIAIPRPKHKNFLQMFNTFDEINILEEYTLVSLFEKKSRNASINLSRRLVSDGLLGRPWRPEIHILGSVHGLIGLYFQGSGCFLWNPATRQCNVLPYPKNLVGNSKPLFLLSRSGPYGFGYDRFQDDYKLVAQFGEGNLELKMYSRNNNSWKRIVAYDRPLLTSPGKFVNGKLHWSDTVSTNYKNWSVVSFDLATEQWGVVEQPTYIEDHEKYEHVALHLGVMKNSLAIFHDFFYNYVDIWMLKEHGVRESWTKVFVIEYPGAPSSKFHLLSLPSFLLSHRDEILVMINSKPMIYNFREKSVRFSRVIEFNDDSKMQIYVESLVSPLP